MGLFSFFSFSQDTASRKEIFLFNTLTGKKEQFIPLKNGEVKMYHCGPTVYQYAHIGNLRSYVFADIIKRLFLSAQYKVRQVINITDVGHLAGDEDEGEDKVEKEARKEEKTTRQISKFYTEAFFNDIKKLGIDTSRTLFPRATDYIREQIALVEKLEKKGYAYKTSDGVYFNTSKFPEYGKLGSIKLDSLKEGARVAANIEKKNPSDFALWKFSPSANSEQSHSTGSGQAARQQEWNSPWGKGFPGWHIECSAMSQKLLGETFDIHTGGIDHIPVHHNNEIAQSESATGKPLARYWMHNAFVTIENEKMAKSLGNFYTISDLEKKGIQALSYRYWLLTAHYRSPVSFTWEAVEGAQTALKRLSLHIKELERVKKGFVISTYKERFDFAIADDLNTPEAIALVWELVKNEKISAQDKKATLLYFDTLLGLSFLILPSLFEHTKNIPEEIQKLVETRENARKEKDWKKADTIRKEIAEKGFVVEDSENGPVIKST